MSAMYKRNYNSIKTAYQSEKDIEQICLSLNADGSVKLNCLRIVGRWLYWEHLSGIILNLGLWLRKRCRLKKMFSGKSLKDMLR